MTHNLDYQPRMSRQRVAGSADPEPNGRAEVADQMPTDQGAQYQRDQMNPTFPIGELRPRHTSEAAAQDA